MRQPLRAEKKPKSHRAHFAEELERRVMLASVVAAFGAQVTFGVGSQPRGVVTADVNGDGKLDLVVSNGAAGTVGVLLGNGSGGFGTQATFAAGTTPFGVAVGDVNRDGRLDLVTANNGSGNVSVLMGNGNGTFGGQQQFGAGTQARFVSIGDVNGDGKPDLVVANYGAGTVSVLLGNGNGSFAGQVTFSAGTQASSIAVGDLNRDGKLDLAVADKSVGTVSVLLGNGNGAFGARSTFLAGTQPFSVAGGDVNGDGRLDLVVAEEGTGVGVLLGNGNGTFGNQSTFGVGLVPAAVVVSDFNGDGRLDIAAANYSSNSVSVLLGNGNGTFLGHTTIATGTSPFSLATGDLNRDGRGDLVVGNFGGGSVGVLAGDAPPYVVSISRSNPSSQNTNASSVTFAVTFSEPVSGVDANNFSVASGGAGWTDPIVVSGGPTVYSVTLNGIFGAGSLGLNLVDNRSITDSAGNGLAGKSLLYFGQQTFGAGFAPYSVSAADLDGDGKSDLVSPNFRYANAVSVLLRDLTVGFKPRATFDEGGSFPNSVTVADLNRDGNPDLVVTNNNTNFISILTGNGNGTFANPRLVVTSNPIAATVGDFNGDGIPDIATADNASTATVNVLLGNGNGTFQSHKSYLAGTLPRSVATADVNGDGKLDLVVANASGNSVSVLLGTGDGTLAPQVTFAAGTDDLGVAAGDVDGDGKIDLVVANYAGQYGTVGVLLGNGNATFKPQKTFLGGTGVLGVGLSDLNNDGKLDVEFVNLLDKAVGVMAGNGDGTFGVMSAFAVGTTPRGVATADFTFDGRPDLAVANAGPGTISVLTGISRGDFTGDTYTIQGPPPPPPPTVTSITRANPTSATTSGSAVTFGVNFSAAVGGVDPSDFKLVASGSVGYGFLQVSGSGASYQVTVNGIHGTGSLQLNLVDNGTIDAGFQFPLGGSGLYNGSYTGPSYLMVPASPVIASLVRTTPPGPSTSASSVTFTATFNENVTGVDASDFALALSGVSVANPIAVSGGPSVYNVTVSGISGSGTLGLNMLDDGTIRDSAGNPLRYRTGSLFQPKQTFAVGSNPIATTAADVSGDGNSDLVVANLYAGDVSVLLGNGNGTFGAQQTFATGSYPFSVVVADVNGDGRGDIVTADNHGVGVSVLLGNGNGTFLPQLTLAGQVSPSSADVADLNNDGKPDIFFVNANSADINVYLGNGNGTFAAVRTFATGSFPQNVKAADFNGDGFKDLLVAEGAASVVGILMGNGDGTFAAEFTMPAAGFATAVSAADVNGDGLADISVTEQNAGHVGVFVGNGNGTFKAQQTVISGTGDLALAPADMNGDGVLDLVASRPVDGSNVVIMFGSGGGAFFSGQGYDGGAGSWSTAVADFTGEGRADLVTVNRSTGTVTMLAAAASGGGTGPVYTIVANVSNVIEGTGGDDAIVLERDADGTDIDWTMGTVSGLFAANDANGLTINGHAGSDTITLDYTRGNPLPSTVHLSGNFSINNWSVNVLSGITFDVGQSTVYFAGVFGPDVASLFRQYMVNGYNGGAWNGVPTASTGVITSKAAADGPAAKYAVGYAYSGDGVVVGQPANTFEVRYTLMGDADLDWEVGSADAVALARHWLAPSLPPPDWDQGNFNFDGTIDFADANLMKANYQTGIQVIFNAAPAAAAGMSSAGASAPATGVKQGRVAVSPLEVAPTMEGDGTAVTEGDGRLWKGPVGLVTDEEGDGEKGRKGHSREKKVGRGR